MIPRQLGYHHHGELKISEFHDHLTEITIGVEYWQYTHPASEETTAKCDPEGEDPSCSASIKPSRGVTLAHTNVRTVHPSLLSI